MKAELIKKEGSRVTLEINIDAESFQKAINQAYKKTKGKYNLPGFRKGKAPKQIIELNYGKGVFYNDALDIIIPAEYPKAVEELGLNVVSMPEIDIKEFAEDGSIVLTADVDVEPEFEVAEYKGLEVEKVVEAITEEAIETQLKGLQEKQSRTVTVERAAENGDTVDIDFEGFVAGEAFEGGKSENYALELGSKSFIPGFEDQLVGKCVGEECEVVVTFPEAYQAEELAGKEATFKVKINEVKNKVLPELNDEFASDTTEFETLAELKEDIKTTLQKAAEDAADSKLKNDIVSKISEKTEIEVPKSMIESQLDKMMSDFNYQLQSQGFDIEKFLEITGRTEQSLRDERHEEAEKVVKDVLVLEKIAKIEEITTTDEDIEKEYERLAALYNIESDKLKELVKGEELKVMQDQIKLQKTMNFLVENAK